MVEQRCQNRKKKRLKVRFGTESPKRVAFTGDTSRQGVFLITGQPEQPGTKVLMEITLPDKQQVVAFGQVRWGKKVPPNLVRHAYKAGMGIRFLEFIKGKDAYEHYIDSQR